MKVSDIDTMVGQLDERSAASDEKWDLYRCHDGRWIVNLTSRFDRPGDRTASGPTIADALTAALASPRLPSVPPRPVGMVGLTVEKNGARPGWVVVQNGSQAMGGLKTRRDAEAAIARHEASIRASQDDWDRTYGPIVAAGVEGVDYRTVI